MAVLVVSDRHERRLTGKSNLAIEIPESSRRWKTAIAAMQQYGTSSLLTFAGA
jgi:hypothetical protein